MRLNDPEAGEAWERSSLASGLTEQIDPNQGSSFNIREALSHLPAPQNTFEVSKIQIEQLEEDIAMQETESEQKRLHDENVDEEEKF